jgi:hypothetical protein
LCGAGDLCARKNVLPCRHARPSFGRGARSNANAAEKRAHHRRLHTATALHVVPVVCCRCLRTTRCAGRPLPRLHGRSAGRSVHDPRRAGRPGCTLALTRSPAPSVARALCRAPSDVPVWWTGRLNPAEVSVCGTGRKTRARTTKFTTYRTHVSHVTSKVGQWPIFEDLFLDFFSLI